jgi:hypothetical protein
LPPQGLRPPPRDTIFAAFRGLWLRAGCHETVASEAQKKHLDYASRQTRFLR